MVSNFLPQGTNTPSKTMLANYPKANQPSVTDSPDAPMSASQMIPQFSTLFRIPENEEPIHASLAMIVTPSEKTEYEIYEKQVETEAQTLIEQENIDTNIPGNKATAYVRAAFNVKAQNGDINLDLLAGVQALAHRKGVTDPEEQERLDQEVIDLANKLDVQMNSESIDNLNDKDFDVRLETNTGEADFSTKIAIASSIVAVTRNRSELRDWVLEGAGEEPLTIVVSTDPSIDRVAGFVTEDNQMFLNSAITWSSGGPHTIMHEFAHLLDSEFHVRDGMLPGMTLEYQQLFTDERERLFDLHETDPEAKNLREYAFTNEKEFLAVVMATFMENPALLKEVSPTLFDLFGTYLMYNPLPPKPQQSPA